MALSIAARCQPLPPAFLPHTLPTAAWQALLRTSPEHLFWPVLARRSVQEQPWAWAGLGLPGLSLERPRLDTVGFDVGLDRLYLAYLEHDLEVAEVPAMERALANPPWPEDALSRTRLIGARLLGPVSLGLSLLDDQESPILSSFELRDALAKFLRLRAAWLEAQLCMLAPETLICLDEPFLDALHSPFLQLAPEEASTLIEEVFAGLNGGRGLAPGCHVDWDVILRMPVDCVICPADEQERLLAASEALQDFLSRGGVIAWALISSDEASLEALTAEHTADRFSQILARAAAAYVSESVLLQSSLLTIDGSLDHLAIPIAERALLLLAESSALIRSRYGLIEEPTGALPLSS